MLAGTKLLHAETARLVERLTRLHGRAPSYRELATAAGTTENAMRSRVYRARLAGLMRPAERTTTQKPRQTAALVGRPCLVCGKPNLPQPAVGHPREFCAPCLSERQRAQRARIRSPQRTCLICDSPIRKEEGRFRYCSPECAYEGKLRLHRIRRGGSQFPEGQVLARILKTPRALGVRENVRYIAVPRPTLERLRERLSSLDILCVALPSPQRGHSEKLIASLDQELRGLLRERGLKVA